MAVTPHTALAQTFVITAPLAATVTDDGGAARTATILSGSADHYVRAKLCTSSGGGTSETDPIELYLKIQTKLNAGSGTSTWTVAPVADGRTKIDYTGTGNGSITFGDVLRVLGFTAGTGTMTTGSSVYSTYPATGLVLGWAREDDTGWQIEQTHAGTEDGTGRAYGLSSTRVRHRRSFTMLWHPRTWSQQASGDYLTPAYPVESVANTSRLHAPSQPAVSTDGPWTWADFLATAPGKLLGFTDAWSSVVSGSRTFFDLTTLRAETVGTLERIQVPAAAPTYDGRRNILLALNRTALVALS